MTSKIVPREPTPRIIARMVADARGRGCGMWVSPEQAKEWYLLVMRSVHDDDAAPAMEKPPAHLSLEGAIHVGYVNKCALCAPAMEKPADEPRKEVQNGPDIPRADVVTGEPRIRDHAAAEDATAADADEKLIEQLHGPHGSGLLHRLEGAQKMHDAGKSISTWVASAIDNEAAKWIRQAADRIAELRAEVERMARGNTLIAQEAKLEWARATNAEAERDVLLADGEFTRDYAKEQRERAMRAEAERDRLRVEVMARVDDGAKLYDANRRLVDERDRLRAELKGKQ